MIEIKFRGIEKGSEFWRYGDLYRNTIPKCSFIHVHQSLGGWLSSEVFPETVGQFIGIKGENDVEIYEDDIIKRGNEIKLVKRIYGDDQDFQGWDVSQVFGKWKVIGNIHHNPELLETDSL